MFAGDTPAASGGTLDLVDMLRHLVAGGWPQQRERPDPRFVVEYLEQIIHVDVNAVAEDRPRSRRRDPDKVRACLASIARNVATAAGDQTIAKDAQLSRDAARDY